MSKKWVILGSFGLAFVFNPALACSSKADFDYSESDMQHALLGDWVGTADLDGESVDFTLSLEQASAKSKTQSVTVPQLQPLCGSRTFIKPAAACYNVTSMPVVGTITSVNPALNGLVDGELTASKTLDPTDFSVTLEDGKRLRGVIEGGALSDGDVWNKVSIGSFSLSPP